MYSRSLLYCMGYDIQEYTDLVGETWTETNTLCRMDGRLKKMVWHSACEDHNHRWSICSVSLCQLRCSHHIWMGILSTRTSACAEDDENGISHCISWWGLVLSQNSLKNTLLNARGDCIYIWRGCDLGLCWIKADWDRLDPGNFGGSLGLDMAYEWSNAAIGKELMLPEVEMVVVMVLNEFMGITTSTRRQRSRHKAY